MAQAKAKAKKPASPAPTVPGVSLIVRVDMVAHGRLGPGKIFLLEEIDPTGSIAAACAHGLRRR